MRQEKITYLCDNCKLESSGELQGIGWISLNIESIRVTIPNKSWPGHHGMMFRNTEGGLLFCSLGCLKKYFEDLYSEREKE